MADEVVEGSIDVGLIVVGARLASRRDLSRFVGLFECGEVVADAVGEIVVAECLEQSGELHIGDVLVFDEEGVDQSGVEFAFSEVSRFAIGGCAVVDEFECVIEFGKEFVSGS